MTKRKMLFTERLMYVDGHTPVNGIITIRLRGTLSIRDIEHGLGKIQAKHPALRATVETTDACPYFVIHDSAPRIPIRRVQRTDANSWVETTLQEWVTPFDMSAGPLVRLVWICGEDISELMLVSHHCICDGTSIVSIFSELLQCIDNPTIELVEYDAFESLADLLPAEIYGDKKIWRKARAKAVLFRLFSTLIPAKWKRPQGDPYLISWQGTNAESSALIARCKEHETTPYAAMCTSFLRAFRDVGRSRFKNKLICPVDVRKFVNLLRPDMVFNYAPTISLGLTEDGGKSFWQAAHEIKRQINHKVSQLNAVEEMIGSELLHGSVSKLISLLFRSKGSYDFAFSNVGRVHIPDTFKNFYSEELLGVTVSVPWRNSTTLISTYYKGRIGVAFVANDGFLPRNEARVIQERAIATLLAEL